MTERTRVLVTYASKMGSTREIAEAIRRELKMSGIHVTVAPCADNVDPEGFDGVIIGSALYTRRWVAREEQVPAPKAIARVVARRGLPAPVTFGGRLDTEHAIGPLSRWMAAEGPLSGDFRDWERIRGWAADIAHQLDPTTAGRQ